jgi:mannose-6-phosphate isomerase-like protein (cupin superfamily)
MKILVTASLLAMLATPAWAQQPAAGRPAPPPPTDLTKGTVLTDAEVHAGLAKLGNDRASAAYRIFTLTGEKPYSVNIEHRTNRPQGAAIHDTDAEMFYVVDGSATMVTGGTIPDGTRNGANVTGKSIQGGVSAKLHKGDWVMVPEGVAHWFSQVDPGGVNVLSFHLPRK